MLGDTEICSVVMAGADGDGFEFGGLTRPEAGWFMLELCSRMLLHYASQNSGAEQMAQAALARLAQNAAKAKAEEKKP
jgi:hypothetical protein